METGTLPITDRSASQAKARHEEARPSGGLQGKLILSFTGILAVVLGLSCWLFLVCSHGVADYLMAERSSDLACVVGTAAQSAIEAKNAAELTRHGQSLLKHRDVLLVGFFNALGEPIAVASKNAELESISTLRPNPREDRSRVLRTHDRRLAAVGSYVQVTTPVMSSGCAAAEGEAAAPQSGDELLGYVTVCISKGPAEAATQRARFYMILASAAGMLASLPIAYLLVHRLFEPIRQLVVATHRIADGELDSEVAVDRTDVIGNLARSFNRMVQRVRNQQEDLARANAGLADANRDLESKVSQRTAQLETANRRLSSEIAEKEDFLRAVSHDLSAPLRNISGMAMMLMKKRDSFDAEAQHRLSRIQKNIEVETGLITELMELSRIKTRRQKLEKIDIAKLVSDLTDVFEEDLTSRHIRLTVDTALPVLHCERLRMRQVFLNLIDNAVKYMGEEDPAIVAPIRAREIHVGCKVRNDEAEFYVRDTGVGIQRQDLQRLFRVFRRGSGPEVQKVAGKGIGLASVKSIVETYSGSIWVESEPGLGSTFRFTINGQYVVSDGGPTVQAAA